MASTGPAAAPETGAGAARPRRVGAVFVCSCALAVAFLVFGLVFPRRLEHELAAAQQFVVDRLGWGYLVVVFVLLIFLVVLAVTPVGRVRLGGDGERPEFGAVSWVAMLMSAGLGLSYLFWGTAEPLIHLAEPPYGLAQPGSERAATMGMRYAIMFWGPHAWGTYAVVALAVGHSSFRHGRPVLVSAALAPLLGDRVRGWLGTVIDVVAVLAILFGVATSLGLGTRELNAGLAYAFGWPEAYGVKIAIIVGLMTVSTLSALTGLGRGIRVLSLVNAALCTVLLAFTLATGPTRAIVATGIDATSGFATHVLAMSLNLEDVPGSSWEQEWTFFFWAWWISWAPFVGTFIARISRGRSIREVVTGVVLVPSLVTVVWFSVFGGTALQRERAGIVDVAGRAADSKAVATFRVLATLPLTSVLLLLVVLVLALLFITSADSAAFMLGSTTAGGSLTPPKSLKLMWAFAAAFAAVLLLDGGTDSLQGAAVVAAVPFTVILVALAVALVLALRRDAQRRHDRHQPARPGRDPPRDHSATETQR